MMPKSGISVESCIIGTWYKQVGDEVRVGDILFDYETDKATFECESTAEGVLLEIFYHAGDEVEVLKPVCAIGKQGEDVSAIRGTESDDGSQTTAEESVESPRTVDISAQSGKVSSPRAKNLADKLGVNVQNAMPTGPSGRVIARDIDRLYQDSLSDVVQTSIIKTKETDEVQMPKIRRVIAMNMLASMHNTAQLTHHHSFDASTLLNLRKFCKNAVNKEFNGISVGDMILYAVSRTLKEFLYMNALLMENDVLRTYNTINLGVAVDTPRGLMVPTIVSADTKSLKQISNEVKELAAQARSGQISPDALQGGTFTVSNLGPTGVEMFTPILNAPQVGILGVCGIVNKVRPGTNGVEVYPSIGLSLTYDHRAVDGAPASRFAQGLVKNLENFPLLLMEN